jgi:hypothetical protein
MSKKATIRWRDGQATTSPVLGNIPLIRLGLRSTLQFCFNSEFGFNCVHFHFLIETYGSEVCPRCLCPCACLPVLIIALCLVPVRESPQHNARNAMQCKSANEQSEIVQEPRLIQTFSGWRWPMEDKISPVRVP